MKRLLLTSVLCLSSFANAMVLDWNGGYRFEWTEVEKAGLSSNADCGNSTSLSGCRKSYGLNYLYLSPKLIAADGINVVSRFEVMGSNLSSYRNNQFGSVWGSGMENTSGRNSDSNALQSGQENTSIKVSQLYLNVNQEYGAFLVGRAPMHFGNGMTFNAGTGAFDHYASIHDIFAYKFIIGNFYFMPAVGRVRDLDIGQGQNMSDEILQLVYDNKESGSLIGLMINNRKSDNVSNDAPTALGGSTGVKTGDLRIQRMNFILGRDWEPFNFKLEIGSLTGDSGISKNGQGVKFNGYGFAAEMGFPRSESKYDWKLRFGMASGDDPNSVDFEGYQFHKNYDVAFLLFNHRLGQADLLGSNAVKDTSLGLSNSLDDESISNVIYLSPTVKHSYSDKIDFVHTLTYAQLMSNSTGSVGASKNLGFEYDFEVVYKPTDKMKWVNQVGLLLPGDAFQNGASNFGTSNTFGFTSKAAISF